jgi:histone-lysine N-methyltransferase SETD3
MIQVNFKPMSHQTYFVNHLLQERRRKNSVWRPYIDVLPNDVSGFPTYFGETELELLRGSPTLCNIMLFIKIETVLEQKQ